MYHHRSGVASFYTEWGQSEKSVDQGKPDENQDGKFGSRTTEGGSFLDPLVQSCFADEATQDNKRLRVGTTYSHWHASC